MYKLNNDRVLYFRFKKLKNWEFFLSNDYWERIILSQDEFECFLEWKWLSKELEDVLVVKWFLKHSKLTDREIEVLFASKRAHRHQKLFVWPNLHIIVVTLVCNQNCIYCHASSRKSNDPSAFQMDKKTAKKVVDTIFQTSSWYVNIEFQWWEPLKNRDVVKYIIEYVKEKNLAYNLNIDMNLVTNLTLMDDEKLEFLIQNNIGMSTSFDGPEEVHNYNRPLAKSNSWEKVSYWIKKINQEYEKRWINRKINAISTITKKSLGYPEEIVDEYIKLWMDKIFVRPVNPYWFAKQIWSKIWFEMTEYLEFYNKILNYVSKKKAEWVKIDDTYYDICQHNVLEKQRAWYTEEMAPCCWAVLGQVAYNWDWWIYTCDEGRMLSAVNDESFKVGQIDQNKSAKEIYREYVGSSVTNYMLLSSMIDFIPWYSTNPYSCFIGLCPIYNYVKDGSLFSKYKNDPRFKIQDWIIEKLIEKHKNTNRLI